MVPFLGCASLLLLLAYSKLMLQHSCLIILPCPAACFSVYRLFLLVTLEETGCAEERTTQSFICLILFYTVHFWQKGE